MSSVEIFVNGAPHPVPEGQTVLVLLESLQLDPARVAVELDGQILRQSYWKERTLQVGARLEIVHLVGGG
ncbi:MAG: sulfur carrier protein ThiS [Acidobacteria bacterium]|nr:sulfur carrier protein ThiS [Acidobacteriota bacterium]